MDAGRVEVLVNWQTDAIKTVSITSSRPVAAQLLIGKTAAQVPVLVPMLFSLCGRAQLLAAQAALKAARGEPLPSAIRQQAEREVTLEALREHLWRLLQDWPMRVGLAVDREGFARWFRLLAPNQAAETARATAQELLAWLSEIGITGSADINDAAPSLAMQILHALNDTCARGTATILPDYLPKLSADEWASHLPTDHQNDFSRMPVLQGQPHEAGAMTRHAWSAPIQALRAEGREVAARYMARWLDVRLLAEALAKDNLASLELLDSAQDIQGRGVACVDTARGMLMHRVALEGAGEDVSDTTTVSEYLVVAPTEWNFHPHGTLPAALQGLKCEQADALELVRRWVLALDPCVAHEVKLA